MLGIIRRFQKLILLMVVVTGFIFFAQYNYSAYVVQQIAEDSFQSNFDTISERVSHWFSKQEKIIEDVKIYFTNESDNNKRQAYLKEKLANNPSFNTLYFISRDNFMLNGSNYQPDYQIDYRRRPCYLAAVEAGKRSYCGVFLNASLDNLVVGISEPIFLETGNIEGVVAGDISLKEITSLLKESNYIIGSQAFISDENDLLIADPDNIVLEKESIEGFIGSRKGKLISGEIKNTGWKINLFIPVKYVAMPMNNLRNLFSLALFFLLASVTIFLFLQRKVITEPLVSYDNTTQEKLEEEKRNFQALFKNSSDAIAIIDKRNRVIDVNSKFEDLFLYRKSELLGKDLDKLIVPANKMEEALNITEKIFKEEISSIESIRVDKLGQEKEVEIKGAPILLKGIILGGYVIYTDISIRKAHEREILYMSYHDQLTGLYNRRYFEKQIKKLDNSEKYPLYLIMADLNGLKLANDAFGHRFGDQVLQKTASLLKKHLIGDEFVARIGGDEFIIVIADKSPDDFRMVLNKIMDDIKDTRLGTFQLSVSFGWEVKTREEENIYDIMNKAESYMYKRKLLESPSMISNTIDIIISTLHEKNEREKLHSERVAEIGAAIGREMGFSQETIKEIKLVGLMHDIGKIGIPEEILNKEGKLTPEEYGEIKKHPEIGYRILNTANQMSDIAQYVLSHHERWDGMGYPAGLRGIETPLIARIIAVADAFDAMTSQRTYRSCMTEAEAAQELLKCAGSQFDPEVIKILVEKVLKL